MNALIRLGKEGIRCDPVTDPRIKQLRATIRRATRGSGLHRFHDVVPAIPPGDIMDHDEMRKVGKGVDRRSKKRPAEAWGATRLSVRTPPKMQASLALARAVT